ncbi:hypothetical protein GJAV_G00069070 [Gymnothorax javanicus]|nr:hypothetical protein GJAV_G00069070 [Gymnothorax javanicus]
MPSILIWPLNILGRVRELSGKDPEGKRSCRFCLIYDLADSLLLYLRDGRLSGTRRKADRLIKIFAEDQYRHWTWLCTDVVGIGTARLSLPPLSTSEPPQ